MKRGDHYNSKSLIRVPARCMLMFVLFFAVTSGLYAQRTSFLYLQSEEGIPFYVKKDKQIYSSTASGYLILSKVPENDMLFYVGFPGSSTPESLFRLSIANGGRGVLIKSFGERGWGLFDFQDASVTYAMATENAGDNKVINNDRQPVNDPFANMLSEVTQDSSVKYVGEKLKQPVSSQPKDSVKTIVVSTPVTPKSDTSADTNVAAAQIKSDRQSETVVQTKEKPLFLKSEIARSHFESGADGTKVSYVISNSEMLKDTVNLFIPTTAKEVEYNSDLTDTSSSSSPKLTDLEVFYNEPDSTSILSEINLKTDFAKDTLKYTQEIISDTTKLSIPIEVEERISSEITDTTMSISPHSILLDSMPAIEGNLKKEVVVGEKYEDKSPEKKPILKEINCKKTASEEDFLKVRRKMAQQSKDEEMINEAQKFFKNMCFTSEQIRNLGALFLTDEGRYRFYDASMKYVLDFQNFKSLENTLITPYFKKRFEALIPE